MDDRLIVEKRLERELWQRVLPQLYSASQPLVVAAWEVPGEPVPYEVACVQQYSDFSVGRRWGRPWGTTWFRLQGDVPTTWPGQQLEAVVDLGFRGSGAGFQAEGLMWIDGEPLQGVHPRRTGVPLAIDAPGPFTLYVEAASNPMLPAGYLSTPLGSPDTSGDHELYRLQRADLAIRDDGVYELLLDIEVLMGVMVSQPLGSPRRARLLRQLEGAFNLIDIDDVGGTASAARRALQSALAVRAGASSMRVVGVGHAHIDSAWLWPIRETIRKCARTFASAVRLMDDRPDYHFVCSQAAQYAWIEAKYPSLFAKISDKVATGQFVPVGGMWVEADMNLPSGESLVRQLVHGQRWFDDRFGMRCSEVWLPDVFGYPASLPQIFAAAGCERFVTQKLSWNKQNRFPHNTFWWEGIDGTRVLSHFPPVDTYNAEVTAEEMAFSEGNFQDHGWSDWALMPFGYGNGGGGPTREMVDRAARMRDLDGAPRLVLGTCQQFFERIEAEGRAGAPIPQWRGELYFEMHRGTLTSQTRTKMGNRRCERLLREAELWLASCGPASDEADELYALWADVLVQQFHDILPGSSIAWVHADAEAEHARIGDRLEQLIAEAIDCLAPSATVAANVATHRRVEVVQSSVAPRGGGPTQLLTSGGTAFCLAIDGGALAELKAENVDDRIITTEHSMANGLLAARWNLEGTIVSLIDLSSGRELLPTGRAITVELAPDQPVEYDAWDLESWTRSLGAPIESAVSVRFVEHGPLLCSLEVAREFATSRLTMTYTMRAGSRRFDIEFDIDWREREKLLSLMIPLDVRADTAACDIQFGHVHRPTHPSSPWDAAKFEVCAHRFVDVSEPAFGVAILNDGRYGHCLFDGGVRVSLLRAANYPDPDADAGRHRVTVAVLAHGAGLHDVLHEAEALNLPIRIVPGGDSGIDQELPAALISIDHPGVQISAVKRADDGSGDIIVRLHEACGDRVQASVKAHRRVTSATLCNALEEPTAAIDVADGFVALPLRPFQLVTLRLAL